MAMYDDDTTESNSKRIEISCKNCDKFIVFYMVPISSQIFGTPFCTIKCEVEYAEKQLKIKEDLTKFTLK